MSIGHFINGEHIMPTESRTQPVYNPATGQQSGEVALASAATTNEAVAAAAAAFPGWSATPPIRRARVLFKFKELCEAHADELCQLLTAEHGKVLSDARGELTRGVVFHIYSRASIPRTLAHGWIPGPPCNHWV